MAAALGCGPRHCPALSPAFEPKLFARHAPLDLLPEILGELAPNRQQRVVARLGVDIRSGDGQMGGGPKGGGGAGLSLEEDSPRGDGHQVVEGSQAMFHEQVQSAALGYPAKLDTYIQWV